MWNGRRKERTALAVATAVVALTVAACSSAPSTSASSTSTTRGARSATTSTSGATTTSTTSSATTTTATLVPQTSTSTEFYAPSGNLECEIDNQFGQNSLTQAMCLTETPAQSATLGADSSLKQCTGQLCLSNAALGTPQLPYGTSITLGPFTCLSMTTGMKCTLGNGNGFVLARSGVTPLGGVTVRPPAADHGSFRVRAIRKSGTSRQRSYLAVGPFGTGSRSTSTTKPASPSARM